jgi:hypothetical protein
MRLSGKRYNQSKDHEGHLGFELLGKVAISYETMAISNKFWRLPGVKNVCQSDSKVAILDIKSHKKKNTSVFRRPRKSFLSRMACKPTLQR